jgi:ATP:ADP antiporter, AAA family
MRNRFLHFMGVESGEEPVVSLLLTQSIFLGLFYGAFDISAHSLFLAVFDETIMARAYVISGLAGIVLTSLYSYIQARLRFRNFAVINLFFVAVTTLILWLLLIANPTRPVIFTVFVMMGPLNILAMLGFWGTTGRLFSLRQGKRLFGLVDAGQVVGIIISSYAIPVLLTFGFDTRNIILLSAAAVLGATLIQLYAGRNITFRDTGTVRKGSVKNALLLFRKDSYVLTMGLFIAVSVMTAFFIQYSFMAVTREQYPLEADMARFLGLFTGSMMIFTLFLKTFLFSYLIRTYGLRIILLLSPLLLVLFTGIAAATGAALGFTPGTGGFMLFFLLLALSRLFSKSLKDAVENPSFKIVYQTLDEKVRYDVQSIVDGTVNEIAALTSGLLLSGLGILVTGSLISFSWVLLAITLLWVYLGYRLYTEYRLAIVRSLNQSSHNMQATSTADDAQLSKSEGFFHRKIIVKRNYLGYLNKEYTLNESVYNKEILESLLPVSEAAQEILSSVRTPQPSKLLRMLRDNNQESKRAALLAIGKYRIAEMLPEVCDALGKPGLAPEASAVLDFFGEEASGELIRCLMKNSGNISLSGQLLRIIGKNCYSGSENIISQLLWASSRRIRGLAAEILLREGYKVDEGEKDKIHQLISEVIGVILWHSASAVVLRKHGNLVLLEAMDRDRNWWTAFLFDLMAIAYDKNYIDKIRENLEAGSIESVNFALEMIDIVLDDSIKLKVSYCVDNTSDEEKLRLLHQFYPVFIPGYADLLTEIINRDYNLTGLWAKAIATRSISEYHGVNELEMTIIALLFSPEPILVEEAARVASGWEDGELDPVIRRVPDENREIITGIVGGTLSGAAQLVSKVRFLQSLAPEIDEAILIQLAGSLKVVGKDIMNPKVINDMFMWPAGMNDREERGRFMRADSTVPSDFTADNYYILESDALADIIAVNEDTLANLTELTNNIELRNQYV